MGRAILDYGHAHPANYGGYDYDFGPALYYYL